MVSAKKYLKTFFSVMPERFKLYSELKAKKAKIDRKVLSGKELSPDEISQLIDIIGKDILFRKAEKRNKYTLRHITWKILKSIRNLKNFPYKFPEQTISDPYANKILNLKQFLDDITPKINDLFSKTDEIYKKEVSRLESILDHKGGINEYKKCLEIENGLIQKTKPLFLEIRQHNITLINLLKQYYRFMKSQRGLTKEIVYYVGELFFIGMGIYICLIGVDFLTGERAILDRSFDLGMAALVLGIMEIVLGSVIFTHSQLPDFIKNFVKKSMI